MKDTKVNVARSSARRGSVHQNPKEVAEGISSSVSAYAKHLCGESTQGRQTTVRGLDLSVKAIRDRLKLSQRQFAERFGLPVNSIRNWEQGLRKPDTSARLLLLIIASRPEVVAEILRLRDNKPQLTLVEDNQFEKCMSEARDAATDAYEGIDVAIATTQEIETDVQEEMRIYRAAYRRALFSDLRREKDRQRWSSQSVRRQSRQ